LRGWWALGRVHRVLTLVADLDLRHPTPRLWWPPGFGKVGRMMFSREPPSADRQPLAMGTASDPTKFESKSKTDVGGEG
jgi:hypothetical protein